MRGVIRSRSGDGHAEFRCGRFPNRCNPRLRRSVEDTFGSLGAPLAHWAAAQCQISVVGQFPVIQLIGTWATAGSGGLSTPSQKTRYLSYSLRWCAMTRRAAVSALLCWFGLLLLRVSPSCFAANEYAPPSELIVSTASLDGRWVAAYASDGTLLLWETGTHHRRNLISDYKFSLGPDGLAFTPNSSSLVVGDANGLIQWLEIPSGKVLRKMQDKAWVDAFAFSADGSRLAAWHHKGITIWDMKTGMELKYLPEESPFTAVALNHDGSVLVTGTEDGKIRKLDLLHDRQIATMELEPGRLGQLLRDRRSKSEAHFRAGTQ